MNRIGMPLTGDFKVIGEIVSEHAGEFSAFGFELSEVIWEGSPKLQRYPVFKFLNKATGMEIAILFSPAEEGRSAGFVATISKPGNHLLNVKDYLRLHGYEEPTRFFRYREANTDVRAFAQDFLQMFDRLLQKELAPIVQGEVWEDTPVDWMGYK